MSIASYTRALIITEVRRQLQERYGEGALFQTADIERWIDLALVDISTKTRCLRTEASAYSSLGGQSYALPTDCLGSWAVTRFEYDGKRIDSIPFDQLDNEFDQAAGKTRTSRGTPKYWVPYGTGFKLWPVPQVSAVMQIWYARVADSVSADAVSLSDIGLSNAFGPAVEDFVVRRGMMLQGDQARADAMEKVYEADLAAAAQKDMADVAPDVSRGS